MKSLMQRKTKSSKKTNNNKNNSRRGFRLVMYFMAMYDIIRIFFWIFDL